MEVPARSLIIIASVLSCLHSEILTQTSQYFRISLFSVIELSISAFGTVWAFIVSVTITAGLSKTCSSFAELVGKYP